MKLGCASCLGPSRALHFNFIENDDPIVTLSFAGSSQRCVVRT